ncbi:hypothetical protein LPN04_31075 [Rugamonas sp. A1-17]|nr:hypothetical protein [Rugamonas sp. A1-17]
MILQRNDFLPHSLTVLDQVAKLFFINEQLRQRSEVFKTSTELDREQARPDALVVLKFVRETAVEFLDASFWVANVRDEKLAAAYRNAWGNVDAALEAAHKLAETEADGVSSNFITVNVVRNLEELAALWDETQSD